MSRKHTRREFVQKSSKIGLACGAFALCPHIGSFGNIFQDDIPDPKKLNYCGYICPPGCPMYVATIENNNEKKKEAYKDWKIAEKYGLEFDAEKVFCYGCKNHQKPESIIVSRCPVRNCVLGKGYDCCIECNDLSTCEFDLWKSFPEFHKKVIEIQKRYQGAKEKV